MSNTSESKDEFQRSYQDPDYKANWHEWVDIACHQAAKDDLLFPAITKWFVDGEILEIGAGVGQLTTRAIAAGFSVTPTDYEPAMVDYMISQQLPAIQVDARRIQDVFGEKTWTTIFSQGASPLTTKDLAVVAETYRSIYDSLTPGGRFILVVSRAVDSKRFSRVAEHAEIAKSTGFVTRKHFRNQALPAYAYRIPGSSLVEAIAGPIFGIRDIAVYEKV